MSEARISLRVYPSAAKNQVVGFVDGAWRVRVSAPPVNGKANRELIAFLSQALDVSQSRLRIIKGHNSRRKTMAVTGLSQEEVIKRLSQG